MKFTDQMKADQRAFGAVWFPGDPCPVGARVYDWDMPGRIGVVVGVWVPPVPEPLPAPHHCPTCTCPAPESSKFPPGLSGLDDLLEGAWEVSWPSEREVEGSWTVSTPNTIHPPWCLRPAKEKP